MGIYRPKIFYQKTVERLTEFSITRVGKHDVVNIRRHSAKVANHHFDKMDSRKQPAVF